MKIGNNLENLFEEAARISKDNQTPSNNSIKATTASTSTNNIASNQIGGWQSRLGSNLSAPKSMESSRTQQSISNKLNFSSAPSKDNFSLSNIIKDVQSIEKSLVEHVHTITSALEAEGNELKADTKRILQHLVLNPHNHFASPGDTLNEIKTWLGNGVKWLPGDSEAKNNGISNFVNVSGGFYRGHVPDSQAAFNWMHNSRKIGTEIDLRQSSEQPQTADWAKNAGINHISLSMPDVGTPSGDQINQLFSIVDKARQQQAQDPQGAHGVFIHCKAGANRTGTMVALTRIREGMSPDDAIKEAETHGMFPITYQPSTQKFAADEISFVLKYGDAYRSLNIRPGTAQEQKFNQFFTNFIEQHKSTSRKDFAQEIVAAWN